MITLKKIEGIKTQLSACLSIANTLNVKTMLMGSSKSVFVVLPFLTYHSMNHIVEIGGHNTGFQKSKTCYLKKGK